MHLRMYWTCVQLTLDETTRGSFSPRPFRYVVMWESHPKLVKVVCDAWTSDAMGKSAAEVHEKLLKLGGVLGSWEKSSFRSVRNKRKDLKA